MAKIPPRCATCGKYVQFSDYLSWTSCDICNLMVHNHSACATVLYQELHRGAAPSTLCDPCYGELAEEFL